MSRLALHLLGSPHIERDDQLVSVDTRKAIALIAYLAVNPGYQSRDTLAALLWPESEQSSARAALRRTLSVLNSALGGAGLEIEREAIAFQPELFWCDWIALSTYVQDCKTHGHPTHAGCPRCLDPLSQAVALWTGEFMQGFSLRDSAEFDLWQAQQAEHARSEYAGALRRLVGIRIDLGDYELALQIAQDWLALDSLNETAHRQLIQLYAWTGQRELAIRQFRECVRILDQELGTPPLEETSALYRLVLENKLARPQRQTESKTVFKIQSSSAPSRLPMIGRQAAWEQLLATWTTVNHREINQQIVAVTGEAGIGKTRLIQEFAAEIAPQTFLLFRCYESEIDLAYAPIIRLLRSALVQAEWLDSIAQPWRTELVRLLPEIAELHRGISDQPVPENMVAQSRLVEAIAQVFDALIAAGKPALLVAEDLQWVDHASLDFLSYFLRRESLHSALLVLSWRPGKSATLDRLHRGLIEYERAGGSLEIVQLQRLNATDVHELAAAEGMTEAGLAERLYRESEGLPFFLVELFTMIASHGFNVQDQNAAWVLPRGVQDLLRLRLLPIDEAQQQLLGAASVIGRAFDDQLLQECSGRSDDEVVEGLDRLLAQGLFVAKAESGGIIYDFFHDMLRRLVYEDLNTARRRLLHRRAAEALQRRLGHQARPSSFSGEIALHLALSGNGSEAGRHYFAAGVYARHVFANHEAINHFQMALALAYFDTARVCQQLGDVYLLIGDLSKATQYYETAMSHCGNDLASQLEHAQGRVCHRMGKWELAEEHYRRALEALDEQQSAERVSILVDWSLTAIHRLDLDLANRLAKSALDLSLLLDDPLSLAQCHNVMGILARRHGDLQAAFQHFQTSLDIAAASEILHMEVAILNNLALTLIAEHRFDTAVAMLQRALPLCEKQGDRHRAAALHNNLADLYHRTGDSTASMEHLKQAVALFAQIGATIQNQSPEIWRLSEW